MSNLIQSRRFWTAVIDMVVSVALYAVGRYSPADLEFTKFLIAAIQPVVLVIIAAYTVEDVHNIIAEKEKDIARTLHGTDTTKPQ